MTYLITCLCQRSLLREKPFGICENCGEIKPQKETQYDVALKDQTEFMDRVNMSEYGKEVSIAQFNKRWNV